MVKYIFFLLIITFLISCGSDDSDGKTEYKTRVVDCENIKPENSSWSEQNQDGKLTQQYDGTQYFPSADSCGWICDEGYIRIGNSCSDDQNVEDSDSDGVEDETDNCPDLYNPDQNDMDQNGEGDLCDPDIDGDGLLNDLDPCPEIFGSNCNSDDSDNDGVDNDLDNCPDIPNSDQSNIDSDQYGDLCDSDIDGDQVDNDQDPCPEDPEDRCVSTDSDDDGIENDQDNCPEIYNPDQDDMDQDGEGDLCEIQDGTQDSPFLINSSNHIYKDHKDTTQSLESLIDQYFPDELDQSGGEYIYMFKLDQESYVDIFIDSRQQRRDEVDIDIHLLSSLNPIELIARGHYEIETQLLQPGLYYISMDSYNNGSEPLEGEYDVTVIFTPKFAGTVDDPIDLSGKKGDNFLELPLSFVDERDTSNSQSDLFDTYPPNTLDESGNEYIYKFKVDQEVRVMAMVAKPEPSGVDIDLHIVSGDINSGSVELLSRGDFQVYARVQPGTYYIIADSYAGKVGNYKLRVAVRPTDIGVEGDQHFNKYMMEAIYMIDHRYRLLGYDSDWLTHDVEFGDPSYNDPDHQGTITRLSTDRTMCVAAVWEIMLTAMELYVEDTGDYSVYDYLTLRSWKTQAQPYIKGHLWVNHDYSHGSADAVTNFGMGEHKLFTELTPGSLLGITRSTGTGHAVVFVAFLDKWGFEYDTYREDRDIIGFKYYSSQGGYDEGNGGMDYRYAIFGKYHGSTFCSLSGNEDVCDGDDYPIMPYKRDLNINYHDDSVWGCNDDDVSEPDDPEYSNQLCRLNTGMMFAPAYWNSDNMRDYNIGSKSGDIKIEEFDSKYFDGETVDDDLLIDRPKYLLYR